MKSTRPEMGLLERAYEKIQEQKRIIERLRGGDSSDEPIAIIGYACRFPGGSVDGPSFWRVLNSGRDIFQEIDDSRWSTQKHHDLSARESGKTYTLAAGLVEGIDQFDAKFFGVPAIEAGAMDPQQRMLLEVSWHALENAGLNAKELRGSATGVFIGLTTDDYARLHARSPLSVSTYTGLGSAKSMAAGRLSYFYDFRGATLQIDTTCSSALVALHLAARELRAGDCNLALVGGANAIVSPDTSIGFCEMKALSRSGKLRSFSDTADGYVRGEGCGVIVMKRLSDALRDGDLIRGVIRGSAVNHDGRTNGLTAPNQAAQRSVISRALESAACSKEDVDYVEAHGTGTRLGDNIEANALGDVYGGRSYPLRIGSAKASIGHLEAASGIASVIKVLLAFEHRYVPGQVNLGVPNTRINWKGLGLDISESAWNWPLREGRARIAGVSSFGMSGTNVHLILQEPPKTDHKIEASNDEPSIILLSAKTEYSMQARLEQLREAIKSLDTDDEIVDLSVSSFGQSHFDEYRYALVANTRKDVAALPTSSKAPEFKRRASGSSEKLAYIFSGQGTQYPGMAAKPYKNWQAFRHAFDACAKVAFEQTGYDLVSICCEEEKGELLRRTEVAQPALVAMGISLAVWWRSVGIVPSVVVGHSIGEYAAAVTAASMSMEEAIWLACERGAAVAKLAPSGLMFAVVGDPHKVKQLCEDLPQMICIAGINAAGQITLACQTSDEDFCRELIRSYGLRDSKVAVDHAFHSTDMTQPAERIRTLLKNVALKEPKIQWIGTSGPDANETPWLEPAYFGDQMLRPVGFKRAIELAITSGTHNFLEIGPERILSVPMRSIGGDDIVIAATMRRGAARFSEHAESLKKLYEAGLSISPTRPGFSSAKHLPLYPFDRKRFWLPIDAKIEQPNTQVDDPFGFQLIELLAVSSGRIFDVTLSIGRQPHLEQHYLFGVPVVAGATWIALLIQEAQEILGQASVKLSNVRFIRPLVMQANAESSVRLTCMPTDGHFKIAIACDGVLHCHGFIEKFQGVADEDWTEESTEVLRVVDLSDFYDQFDARGYHLGESFRWIKSGSDGRSGSRRTLLEPKLTQDGRSYPLFPGLIDSCFHGLSGLLASSPNLVHGKEIVVPSEIAEIKFYGGDWQVNRYDLEAGSASQISPESLSGDLALYAENRTPVIELRGATFRKISSDTLVRLTKNGANSIQYLASQWQIVDARRDSSQHGLLVFFGDHARAETSDVGSEWPSKVYYRDEDDIASLIEAIEGIPDGSDVFLVHSSAGSKSNGDIGGLSPIVSALMAWLGVMAHLSDLAIRKVLHVNAIISENEGNEFSFERVANGALIGLLKSVRAEHPSLRLRIIRGGADSLLANVRCGRAPVGTHGEYRLVGERWEALRLAKPKSRDEVERTFDLSDGTVVITGGSGALAPYLIPWLRSLGAQRIKLVSRSCRESSVLVGGIQIESYACDVTDEMSVAGMFENIRKEGSEVIAVVHAAGVLADRPFAKLSREDLLKAIEVKLGAVINMAKFWRQRSIRLFVGLSSLVSITGSPAQAAYTAANRALDCWVDELRSEGVHAYCVNLGPVNQGMASRLNEVHKQRLRRVGLKLLPAEQLAEALDHVIFSSDGALAAFAGSDARLIALDDETSEGQGFGLGEKDTLHVLCAGFAELLGSRTGEEDPDVSLQELGMDSLLAVELATWVNGKFNIELSIEVVLAQPNLRSVASRIDQLLSGEIAVEEPISKEWIAGEI